MSLRWLKLCSALVLLMGIVLWILWRVITCGYAWSVSLAMRNDRTALVLRYIANSEYNVWALSTTSPGLELFSESKHVSSNIFTSASGCSKHFNWVLWTIWAFLWSRKENHFSNWSNMTAWVKVQGKNSEIKQLCLLLFIWDGETAE